MIVASCAALWAALATPAPPRLLLAWPPAPYAGAIQVDLQPDQLRAYRAPAYCLAWGCPRAALTEIGRWPWDQAEAAACALWAPGYVYAVTSRDG
jgi:hypothetical protein